MIGLWAISSCRLGQCYYHAIYISFLYTIVHSDLGTLIVIACTIKFLFSFNSTVPLQITVDSVSRWISLMMEIRVSCVYPYSMQTNPSDKGWWNVLEQPWKEVLQTCLGKLTTSSFSNTPCGVCNMGHRLVYDIFRSSSGTSSMMGDGTTIYRAR